MPSFNFDPFESQVVIAGRYYPGMAADTMNFIQKASNNAFRDAVLTEDDDPRPALEAVKNQKDRKITLLVQGKVGAAAIRYLCDDFDLPLAERRVQWIHCLSVGLDALQLKAIPEIVNAYTFTNAKTSQSRALAEYCMYSMLYFSRKTWQHQQNLAEHKWEPYNITELYGRKVVIFGYGDIGREAAKRALAFEMEVTGVKRSRPDADVDDLGVRVLCGEDNSDDVLREADFVVNCMPCTPENVDFFNKERFALMKPTAVYVNIGRGGTNNENDLIEALNSGVIRGAAVDVFKTEPLVPTDPLFSVPSDKILLTSHNGAQTNNQTELLCNVVVHLAHILKDTGSLKGHEINKVMFY